MSLPDYCPRCDERTSLPEQGICPWCDTRLVPKGRGGRPAGVGGKLTEAQLRALHHAYVTQGQSVNALAKIIYAKVGYKSHHTASGAIYAGWARLGLERRERIEAVRLACITHGRGARDRDEKTYREFLKERRGWRAQQGPGQQRCAAVKRLPPEKGRQCLRPSLEDSDFCQSHDPRREPERQATLARMRRRQPRPEMLPIGPFVAWLTALAAEHGSLPVASQHIGMDKSAAYRLTRRLEPNGKPKATSTARTGEKYAQRAGTTIDEIYGPRWVA